MRIFTTLLSIISSYTCAYALYISEIMYDPSGADIGREWVEVYNDTSSSIVLSSWKFLESGTNHGITIYQGGDSIPASGYAVIADNAVKFLADFPSYQGVLYDSAFSLINTGEPLTMKDGGGSSIDTVTYDTSLGGVNDGTTLSKISGAWVRGNTTPGAENTVATLVDSGSGGGSGFVATTTDNQGTIAQMSPPSSDIVLYLPLEKIAVAGADTELTTHSMTRGGKVIENVKYTWAFGDGGQGSGASTTHRFVYPGRYLVYVQGTNGLIAGDARMFIHVVSPDMSISKIGAGKYGNFVEVTNPNNYDVDLSGWYLVIQGMRYPFPKYTTLLAKGSTRFAGLSMGFASTTLAKDTEVKIIFPNLEEVVRYIETPRIQEAALLAQVATSSPRVLGVSTTTARATPPKVTNTVTQPKPVTPTKKIAQVKSPKPLAVATSSVSQVASTTKATSSKPIATATKDTRLVQFLKAWFWR